MSTPIGRRIAVYGQTGSGKSTLARQLGDRLGLPVIELDALFHRANWEPTPEDEFRAKVLAELDKSADGWVCDGNYSMVREIVLPRADTIVRLRLPWRVSFWRLLKRTIRRAWTKESLWGTNYESWRMAFLSKDSILLWGITHHRAHARNFERNLERTPHRASVIELRSSREVAAFLASVGEHAGARAAR